VFLRPVSLQNRRIFCGGFAHTFVVERSGNRYAELFFFLPYLPCTQRGFFFGALPKLRRARLPVLRGENSAALPHLPCSLGMDKLNRHAPFKGLF
jgi:hypothetical protein